jgi:ABC-2 type transport system ATP-binding protein
METADMSDVLLVNIEEAGYDDCPDTIRQIEFAVRSGELLGLIGPNGAGKSTTIKAVLGLLKRMRGEIRFVGPRRSYSYIPEHPILYEELTLWEHLELAAAAYEMPPETFRDRAEALLERFRLSEVRHQLTTSFSKGMQQKVMLILGFLTKPDVYIVDEPFIGLDPKATKELLDMLNEERKRGAGILMSTHVLDTAERICDSFLLIDGGRLVAKGSLEDIRARAELPGGTLFDCFHTLT